MKNIVSTTRCLLVLGVVLLLGSTTTSAEEGGRFAGKWHGTYKNTEGGKGDTALVLTVVDGKLTGTWDEAALTGKQINPNSAQLHGKSDERSYQMTLALEKGTMTIKYVVTYRNKKGSYEGTAELTRDK